ncbi:MAG: hypothetical protein U9Q15_05125 [Patescibacteria group bacterium]|nr:hypothetical protein [Patescibacteria group bacterium]
MFPFHLFIFYLAMLGNFPGQHADETVQFVVRKHWVVMLRAFLRVTLYFVFSFALVWAMLYFEFFSSSFVYLLLAILMHILAWTVFSVQRFFIDHYLDMIIVTDQRLLDIDQDGLFKRQIEETSLNDIIDVKNHVSGFWGSLLRYGTLEVRTASHETTYDLDYVPKPDLYTQKIMRVARDSKQKFELYDDEYYGDGGDEERVNSGHVENNTKIPEEEDFEYPSGIINLRK